MPLISWAHSHYWSGAGAPAPVPAPGTRQVHKVRQRRTQEAVPRVTYAVRKRRTLKAEG